MVSQEVTVRNLTGLHLRPAGILCREALRFQSKITFTYGTYEANAKSVLSVLSAGVQGGQPIRLSCDGPDEKEALKALIDAIEQGLGEPPFPDGSEQRNR